MRGKNSFSTHDRRRRFQIRTLPGGCVRTVSGPGVPARAARVGGRCDGIWRHLSVSPASLLLGVLTREHSRGLVGNERLNSQTARAANPLWIVNGPDDDR